MTEGLALQLDERQAAAAGASPERRQIVLAPPGTGKTQVVAALVGNLVDEHALSPADEILAISFSRAAVSALRSRASGRDVGPVTAVRTLDSLASRVLDELDDREEWQRLDFDDRVRRARDLLRNGAQSEDLSLIRHLVVDEVQDLVGVRAELMLAVLERLDDDAGFTVLGDPRQAVYNFQLEAEGGMTSEHFLDRVRDLGDVEEHVLVRQYRARSHEAQGAALVGQGDLRGEDWIKVVRTFTAKLLMAGHVRELGRPVQRWAGPTAFLCRTNGHALMVAGALREAGLAVSTRAPAEELPIAPWIGATLGSAAVGRLRRDETLPGLESAAPMPPQLAWRVLKSIERDYSSPDRLDARLLASRIATGDVPADVLGVPSDVVVSTVHRAKGLEFDNVILVNAGELLPGGATEDDASVAYVALTRARDQLMAATCAMPPYLRLDKATGRWIVGGHQRWHTRGFEVRGIDTRGHDATELDPPPPTLSPGTGVTTVLDPRRSTLDVPVYSVMVDGRPVARTSVQFGELLARRIGLASRRRVAWPTLAGLAVESVETVANMTPAVGGSPLGLSVRVSGMAMLEWSDRGGRRSD